MRLQICKNPTEAHGIVSQLMERPKWPDKLGILVAGIELEKDSALEGARADYEKAMASSSPDVARCAEERFYDVAHEERGFRSFFGAQVPPGRWFHPNVTRGALYTLLSVLLGGAFVWFILWSRRRLRLGEPTNLSGTLPEKLFTAELVRAIDDVGKLLTVERKGHQMKGSSALALSSQDIPESIVSGLPSVFGVEIGKILPALLWFYYRCFPKLECGISDQQTAVVCYASLRKGKSTWATWTTSVRIPPAQGSLTREALATQALIQVARRVAYRTAAWAADPKFRDP